MRVRAGVAVASVALQHVVGRNQDRVRDRDLGSALHVAGCAGVLNGQIVLAVHSADRAGGLDQQRSQPRGAVLLTAGLCLPADSFIAGAKPAQAARWAAVGTVTYLRRSRR